MPRAIAADSTASFTAPLHSRDERVRRQGTGGLRYRRRWLKLQLHAGHLPDGHVLTDTVKSVVTAGRTTQGGYHVTTLGPAGVPPPGFAQGVR